MKTQTFYLDQVLKKIKNKTKSKLIVSYSEAIFEKNYFTKHFEQKNTLF